MNIQDLSALERTAAWLDEAIRACRKGGAVYSANPKLTTDVFRKAKALRTSLKTREAISFPKNRSIDMLIDPQDGRCRTCGGQLNITDADDATMTVECTNPECGDGYLVEPDAFGDGCMTYYIGAMQEQLEDRDEA